MNTTQDESTAVEQPIVKTYKLQLCPTPEQEELFFKFAGCCRVVYNLALRKKDEFYKTVKDNLEANPEADKEARGEIIKATYTAVLGFDMHPDRSLSTTLTMMDLQHVLRRSWVQEFPWLSEAPNLSLKAVLQANDRAFTAFFRRLRNGETPGFPKPKKRSHGIGSFKFFTSTIVKRKGNTDTIQIPKVGAVALAQTGYFPQGKIAIKSGSVKHKNGKWYVTITVAESNNPNIVVLEPKYTEPPIDGTILAVHFGIRVWATLSNGKRFEMPNDIMQAIQAIAKQQKQLSRKKRGSANYEQQKKRIADIHERVANKRLSLIHELTSYITHTVRPSVLVMDDWEVQQMARQGDAMALRILNAAWSTLQQQLTYKCSWHGTRIVRVPSDYAVSKRCSACGEINEDFTTQKIFQCPKCGAKKEREENAIQNQIAYAKRVLHEESEQAA